MNTRKKKKKRAKKKKTSIHVIEFYSRMHDYHVTPIGCVRVLSRRACKSSRWNQCQFRTFAYFDSMPNLRQAVNQLANNCVRRRTSNDLLVTMRKTTSIHSTISPIIPTNIARFVSPANLSQWQMQKINEQKRNEATTFQNIWTEMMCSRPYHECLTLY